LENAIVVKELERGFVLVELEDGSNKMVHLESLPENVANELLNE